MSETVDEIGPEPTRCFTEIEWGVDYDLKGMVGADYADYHRKRADMAEGLLSEAAVMLKDQHWEWDMDDPAWNDLRARIAAHLGRKG